MSAPRRPLPHDHLVIHCSATRATDAIDAAWIDRLHKSFGWRGIGYNFVVTRRGEVQKGRPLTRPGAHVGDCNVGAYRTANWNSRSIGVCLAGGVAADGRTPENNYTGAQWAALSRLIDDIWSRARGIGDEANTLGHRDLIKLTGAPAKACPCFSVKSWLRSGGLAAADGGRAEADLKRREAADLKRRETAGDRRSFAGGLPGLVRSALHALPGVPPEFATLLDIAERVLSPETHTVKRGDTLWSLSQLYGVPVRDLIANNRITDPADVPVGTLVRIYR